MTLLKEIHLIKYLLMSMLGTMLHTEATEIMRLGSCLQEYGLEWR